MTQDDLRAIPSVQTLAQILVRKGVTESEGQATALARAVQASVRDTLLASPGIPLNREIDRQVAAIEGLFGRSRYRPVLNATGILIHTNLGRAAVSDATAEAMRLSATSAVSLEIEPETGRRGGRMAEISRLMNLLTGAESTLLVNNNAAAILLVLSALAAGRHVAVSRAEAVEIGGGFRIPDVLRQSGAELVEVGTTNRTYASDYGDAGLGTGDMILKVHSSNFAISGFVASPSLDQLRDVANDTGALLVEDLGSGTLVDTARYGTQHEPTIQESLAAGVDVITFSGDKLLGGPQAGLIAGKRPLVEVVAKAPLARAVRADKTTLAGVAATLRHYLHGDAEREIPLLRALALTPAELRARAQSLKSQLEKEATELQVEETTNFVGGGALPGQSLPGVALAIGISGVTAEELARRLRVEPEVPVYSRIENDRVLVELRTVRPVEDDVLLASLKAVTRYTESEPEPDSLGR